MSFSTEPGSEHHVCAATSRSRSSASGSSRCRPPRPPRRPRARCSAGYRHIDTAAAYRNEAAVGQAVHAAGLDREEVFITTKCFNDDHGFEQAQRALKDSLHRLEMEHVDLYLIHWPVPSQDRYVETWQGTDRGAGAGPARGRSACRTSSPPTSSASSRDRGHARGQPGRAPPALPAAGLRREHADLGIVTEAWSPLAQGAVLDDPVIVEIAAAHERTPAQVVIRWHLQLGNVVIPKSVTPERIEENFDVFDFHLSDSEMAAIEALDVGERTGPDPDTFVRPPA